MQDEGLHGFALPGWRPLANRTEVLIPDASAAVGIISDIDDTVLQSSITDWKTAAQLTFLGNARTRKPLLGVAKLYAALQAGVNPLFYVSSSPWNLYDLLEDFMRLNEIPPGPIFLFMPSANVLTAFNEPRNGVPKVTRTSVFRQPSRHSRK